MEEQERYCSPANLVVRFPNTTIGYWAQLRYTGKGPRFVKLSAKKVLYTETAIRDWLRAVESSQTGVA